MRFEVLSPLLIGGGNEQFFELNSDYSYFNKSIHFFDNRKFLEVFDTQKQAKEYFRRIANGENGFNLRVFCKENGLDERGVYSRSISYKMFPRSIQMFLRTGVSEEEALIPGSSIKGAIRSIILKHQFDELSAEEKQNFVNQLEGNSDDKASQSTDIEGILVNGIPRENESAANYNIMRALSVSDINVPVSSLSVFPSRILSLQNNTETNADWKNFTVHSEGMPPGAIIDSPILCFDQHLIGGEGRFARLNIPATIFNNLKTIVNEYSKRYIQQELAFLEMIDDPRTDLEKVITFYKDLLLELNDSNVSKMIFRMGAGSGWKFMTGHLVADDENLTREVKRRYDLGKRGVTIFPKSRRIIVNEQQVNGINEALFPIGWVAIDFEKYEETATEQLQEEDAEKKNNEEQNQTNIGERVEKKVQAGDVVKAKLVSIADKTVTVNLCELAGYENENHSFQYAASKLFNDKPVFLVIINDVKKGRVTAISFKGFIN